MLANTGLPGTLWAESMHHGNWLQIILPTKTIENNVFIPLRQANANVIDFSALPTFEQPGFYPCITNSIKKATDKSASYLLSQYGER